MNARQQQIIQLVNERGSVSVSELSRLTRVSEVTIRQDLTLLEKGRYLKRVHGSAISVESDNVEARMQARFPLKQSLAEYAASQINAGESVFIEGGSTNALLARRLANNDSITIVTVSHYIAGLLKESRCEVIVLGGLYQKSSESVVGPLTRSGIQQVHFQKAFIGIDGWHPDTGFTGRNMLRSDIVNAVMAKDIETYALTDSSKFGQFHPYPIATDRPFRHVITDDGLEESYRQKLAAQNIAVHLVKEKTVG
ncbi:DNA-binding transcriptional regulator YciT [Mixta tenebrionis]|uniref:DeoR/GlpR transcriptional regulator n=1 Tax=Mixta tenebrionis TaxID=2562439 RepID=A0A506V7R0_9GAMM|nr:MULTISPECIES: DNA-binding transcriptional regulator YciT [Mixta]QHM76473.1 Glucitol operon repressor [Mixta theicola]TPW41430.1 DeoR/GlpR transcriptional regulator [Mixta tenebrionis]